VGDLIGYSRVSTDDQDHALQTDALEKAGCIKVFSDTASGALDRRPHLDKALDYLRAGDTLVVWRLDRLGRSLPHLIATVTALEKRGIGFRSLTEGFDTTTPGGKLLFHVLGALAEFERNIIRERTRAGLEAARARGRKGGRRPKVTDAKLAMAKEMYSKTGPDGKRVHTVAEIAEVIGVSRATVYRAFSGGGNP
jgi:DNA invertase Pin-like site-specific DNA recombinase